MELKVLRTRVGLGLLGAAVFDDILVILLLSTVLAIFSGGGGFFSILLIILRIVLYLGGSIALRELVFTSRPISSTVALSRE